MKVYNEFSNPIKTIEFRINKINLWGIFCNFSYFVALVIFLYAICKLLLGSNIIFSFTLILLSLLITICIKSLNKTTQSFSKIDLASRMIQIQNSNEKKVYFQDVDLIAVFVNNNFYNYSYTVGMLYNNGKDSIILGNGKLGNALSNLTCYAPVEDEGADNKNSALVDLNHITIKAELAAEKIRCDFVSNNISGTPIFPKNKFDAQNKYKMLDKDLNCIFNRKVRFYIFINALVIIISAILFYVRGFYLLNKVEHLPNLLGY